jgi:hypothetical protein
METLAELAISSQLGRIERMSWSCIGRNCLVLYPERALVTDCKTYFVTQGNVLAVPEVLNA